MSPHVPNNLSSTINSNPSHSYISHIGNIVSPATMSSPSIIDKKRGRPMEEFSPARKKVASELMAFEFQSLSLSNADGSAPHAGSDSEGSIPRRHPPVQQDGKQVPQPQHQHLHQQPVDMPQQQQRSRAKSSPVGPSFVSGHGRDTRSGQANSHRGLPSPPLSLFSPSASQKCENHYHAALLHSHEPYCDSAAVSSTPSSSSSFSPLSPPISPPPSATSTVVDMTMMMDEGVDGTSRMLMQPSDQELYEYSSVTSMTPPPAATDSTPSSSSSLPPPSSEVKVLNLRQRKWNSISKEWQEWQEVQATHTPHLPLPMSHTSEMQSTSNGGSGPTGAGSGPVVAQKASDQWTDGYGNDISETAHAYGMHPQSSGLGRQRSFHGPGEKESTQNDPRNSYGARARVGLYLVTTSSFVYISSE
ncbi:hypothetical protein BGX27_004210 [Mortierella sp. AM989]|nr:hypothetical protein BGX27_004210 [Mortierella sp. AM989]